MEVMRPTVRNIFGMLPCKFSPTIKIARFTNKSFGTPIIGLRCLNLAMLLKKLASILLNIKNWGVDPYPESKRQTTAELGSILDGYENRFGVDFMVDSMTWISTDPSELENPRMLYNPGVPNGNPLRYCGSGIQAGVFVIRIVTMLMDP
ncbi:MAG: hypothetical protein Ct9H300mP4_05830 [Gammaproteobacteria bacterium]|nr:MAG: hypothetical protein Ct9H300mP4_05830 [Gammaproteobacteria bacterium]